MLTMRIATPSDAPALTQLAQLTYRVAFGASMSPDALTTHFETTLSESAIMRFIKKDVVLLAFITDILVGYCHLSELSPYIQQAMPHTTPTNSASLRRLYIHPDHQNKGIGSALLRTALAHPLLAQSENIYLDVWKKNTGAQQLYARHGFQVISRIPFIDALGHKGSDDLVMRLNKDRKNR